MGALVPLVENPPWTRRSPKGEWQKFVDDAWKIVPAAELLKLTKLRTLDLRHNALRSIPALGGSSALTTLRLGHNSIGGGCAQLYGGSYAGGLSTGGVVGRTPGQQLSHTRARS